MEKNNTPATLNSIQQFNFFNPEHFAVMQRVAKMFANSDLVPDMYKVSDSNSIEKAMSNCVIAIEIATRIGANVLMVMQNMAIIYGKPAWSSKFLIATVNTCGRFESLKFRFENLGVIKDYKYTEYETVWNQGKKSSKVVDKTFEGPVDNIQCVAYTTAKGSTDVLESAPVSVELALNEGWYTKKGSKWPNMTKLMLTYRAASFWTSTYAPDLSMGMKTADEIRDIEDVDYEYVSNSERKTAQKVVEQPDPSENNHSEKEPETVQI